MRPPGGLELQDEQHTALDDDVDLAIASSCLCVVLFNRWFSASVRGNQQLVNERQRFIAQNVQLSRLNTEIIQTLARLAVAHDDSAIKALLSAQGISYLAPPTGATIETGDRNACLVRPSVDP